MILLNKNSENTIALTLAEKVSFTGTPYYYFSFVNDNSGVETYFTTTADTSSSKSSYNEFTIIETGSTEVNLSAATVNLNTGFYSYKIYSSHNPYDLSISARTDLVEVGKVYVSGDTISSGVTQYITTATTSVVYYNNE